MDLLARREHSVAELHRKLVFYAHGKARAGAKRDAERQKPDAGFVDEVVEKLQNEGLVSDARFTEAFVRYRASNGYGPQRIQAELRERGVSEKMRAVHLDFGDPLWFERALRVRRKRFGEGHPKDLKERARQARFLQYRGFTTDQVRQVLDGDAID
ncbi:MAG: regulatory protein RecX [Gammaproteobacteria bacterium]|nr:regulatory protein RecX [Gammaproteobacteria bacterium]